MVMTEAAKAAAAAAAAGQEGSPPLSPSTRQPNTAEHLVLYGASKVADRLTRWEVSQAGWLRMPVHPDRVDGAWAREGTGLTYRSDCCGVQVGLGALLRDLGLSGSQRLMLLQGVLVLLFPIALAPSISVPYSHCHPPNTMFLTLLLNCPLSAQGDVPGRALVSCGSDADPL